MKRIHFQGAGGVGMAGVAFLLKRRGFDVSGCDRGASPRTAWLEANGIPVAVGHAPSHLDGADELVVTPAVPPDDPELREAERRAPRLRVRRRGEVLAEIVNAADGIAVCGTHGKTTTATFTARLLRELGDDPAWCIGGETGDMPVAGVGAGPLVVEADESDGTLALYRARTLVITSLDYDHPEHFKTRAAYRACYDTAVRAAGDVIRAWDLDAAAWPELARLVHGAHNVANARAAVEVALRRGHAADAIRAALPAALAALPDRRFQRVWPPPEERPRRSAALPSAASGRDALRRGRNDDIQVYTDYAHHPAELACAIGMAADLKPRRLRVLFQPHRYSRTKALLADFPPAFAAADEVVLIPVYPAFEQPIPGGDIADLYAAFRTAGARQARPSLLLARSAEEAWKHVFLTREPGDLILLAGAGDIIALLPRIHHNLSTPQPLNLSTPQPLNLSTLSFYRTGGVTYGGGERCIVGMGSNTWFSDCATDVEIVRAPEDVNGPDARATRVSAALPGAALVAAHPELAALAGIPGTVGGWAKMNAGAFGDAFGNHVDYVIADGVKIPHDACGFAYRTSAIKGLITEVGLKTDEDSDRDGRARLCLGRGRDEARPSLWRAAFQAAHVRTEAAETAALHILARRKTFPPRTCGSVFKNPSADAPAGRLLDEAGVKGLRVGGARVWDGHANVIAAEEGCTSSDILALARLMARAVWFRAGVRLEPEVRGMVVW